MDQPPHRTRRLGVADIAATYGAEAVQHRIAQLRACGQHYDALAIEREIRSATGKEGMSA